MTSPSMVQLITQANDAATILQRTQRGRVARRTNRPMAQGAGYVPEPRGTSPTTTIAASLVGCDVIMLAHFSICLL